MTPYFRLSEQIPAYRKMSEVDGEGVDYQPPPGTAPSVVGRSHRSDANAATAAAAAQQPQPTPPPAVPDPAVALTPPLTPALGPRPPPGERAGRCFHLASAPC
jgi:hypothetical protein